MNKTAGTNVSPRTLQLLQWEVGNLNRFLNEFEAPANGEPRMSLLGETGQFITIQNMPLPDSYHPDYCDLMLLVDDFPARPPVGIYALYQDEQLVALLRSHYNAFRNAALHDAPSINGYTWLCFHFNENRWRYRPDAPSRGDNLRKFLAAFHAGLSGAKGSL